MTIGLFGGSFNPIHMGHCILANYILQNAMVDEVWFNVSPQNPLKDTQDPTLNKHKLEMVRLAIEGCKGIKVCDIEYSMPIPSYTIATLSELTKRHLEHRFKLIIGADNWQNFQKWKDWQKILDEYGVIVYPRLGYGIDSTGTPNACLIDAPIIEISSTYIRNSIASGLDMKFFLPQQVFNYIKEHKLYGYSK